MATMHNVFANTLEIGDVIDLGTGGLTQTVKTIEKNDECNQVTITYASGQKETVAYNHRFNLA